MTYNKIIMKQDIANRLKEFIDKKYGKRGGMAKFARDMGVSPQSISPYLSGKVIPGHKFQDRVRSLGGDIEYIMTGNTSILQGRMLNLAVRRIDELEKQLQNNTPQYPILATVPAGHAEIFEVDSPEYEDISFDPRTHFFVRVDKENGISMMPVIEPGDLVLVSTSGKIKDGAIVLAKWTDKKAAIKIINFQKDYPDVYLLSSYNPAFQPFTIKKSTALVYPIVMIKKNFKN